MDSNPNLLSSDVLALLTQSTENFSPTEAQTLSFYFTNVERSVVALKNLPEVIKGALFSRYSRSAKGVRRLFLDEFFNRPEIESECQVNQSSGNGIARGRAESFYLRLLSDYGDDSVGELGGAHIAFQEISQLAAKAIEDNRLGASYLEKSSRYVQFDDQVNGRFRYYRDRRILASPYAEEFERTLDYLFDAYSQSFPLMIEYLQLQNPIEEIAFENTLTGETTKYSQIHDEEFKKSASSAYRQAIRARACDSLRGFLPLATLTNVGVYANGRALEYLLTKLYSDPLDETQFLAFAANHELNQVIGPFIKRAISDRGIELQNYIKTRRDIQKRLAQAVIQRPSSPGSQPGISNEVKKALLIGYDHDATDKVVAAILFPYSSVSGIDVRRQVTALSTDEKERIIGEYLSDRKNRRHKPGRAFERTQYEFELLLNIGEYRDLQRHRVLSPIRQEFTTDLGYDLNLDIARISEIKGMYEKGMGQAHRLFSKMSDDLPTEAQYLVPLGYKIRYNIQLNLREAYHWIELRSSEQGHPDYRRTSQAMYEEIKKIHPFLARGMIYANLTPDIPIGRLRAEMRRAQMRLGTS